MLPPRCTPTRLRRRVVLLRRYGVVVRKRDAWAFGLMIAGVAAAVFLLSDATSSPWRLTLAILVCVGVPLSALALIFAPIVLFHRQHGPFPSTTQLRALRARERRLRDLEREADERAFKLPRLGPRARSSGLAERSA